MNAQPKTLPPLAPMGQGSSAGARVARGAAGNNFGRPSVPPIEQRFTAPIGVHNGPDPLAVWPARPRIARNSRTDPKGHWALGLAIGAIVFALGAINTAAHLGYSSAPVIVHLVWPV